MTLYSVDGDIGAMTSEVGALVGAHGGNAYSAMILQGDNDIPLDGLTFNEISWKIRFPAFEDRLFLDADLNGIQYDSAIGGFLGLYEPGDLWFTRTEGIDEGLEIHGGVDGAWWQIIFTGLGRALFTNGQQSAEIDLIGGDMYVVSMSLNPETGYAAITITDRFDKTLSTLSATGLSIDLVESHLGASGTTFNYRGDLLDASGDISPMGERTYSMRMGYGEMEDRFPDSYEGAQEYYFDGTLPLHAGKCGTSPGFSYWAWTQRPWWADCSGMLDFTFGNWIVGETWYKFIATSVPDGYKYLLAKSRCYGATFPEKHVKMHAWITWPTYLWAGNYVGSSPAVPVQGTGQYALTEGYVPVLGSGDPYGDIVAPGIPFYLSNSPAELATADVFVCGSGFDWPYLTGTYGAWRCSVDTPGSGDGAGFWWVPFVDFGEELKVEIDDIWFDNAGLDLGDVIEDIYEVSEGWNEEMVRVEDGIATIRATPVQGTVNIFAYATESEEQGAILAYGSDWEEADDLGLRYRIYTDDDIVSITYFVSRPTFDNQELISRPWILEWAQNLARGVLGKGP